VVKQIEVPQIQTIEKIVEVPFVQIVEKIVEIPTVGNTVPGEQRAVNVQLETVRQVAPTEAVEEVVVGPPLPMETAQPILRGVQQEMPMGFPMAGTQMMMEPVMHAAPMMTSAPMIQGGSVSMAAPVMSMGGAPYTMAPGASLSMAAAPVTYAAQ